METTLRYNQNNPFLFAERGGLEGENKYKRGGFLNESKFKKLTGLCPAPIGANFAPNPKAGQVLHAGSPLSSRLHASAYDLHTQSNYQKKAGFSSNTNGMTENFLCDGLALIHRGTTSFINEPYVTGGNPILSTNDGVMFNDMLGNTIATKNDTLTKINMTAFGSVRRTAEYLGDSDDKAVSERSIFFTGKPNIGELGYAFLFRNYRADQGKWNSQDPMGLISTLPLSSKNISLTNQLGYPDGWNNLAYGNNNVFSGVDVQGTKWVFSSETDNRITNISLGSALETASVIASGYFAIGGYWQALAVITSYSYAQVFTASFGNVDLPESISETYTLASSITLSAEAKLKSEISGKFNVQLAEIGINTSLQVSLGVSVNNSTTNSRTVNISASAGSRYNQYIIYQPTANVRYMLYNSNTDTYMYIASASIPINGIATYSKIEKWEE